MPPVALIDAEDACIWAAAVAVIIFTVQYTLSSPWWRDPVGRTVVAKDIALLILLVPACLILRWPTIFTALEDSVVSLSSTALIAVIMLWRCVVWFRIKKPWPLSRDDKDS